MKLANLFRLVQTVPALDALTGLGTREHLAAHLAGDSELAWCVRVDLDSLIFANHHHGHVEVDDLIIRVARALADLAGRLGGAAFRVGGDDFVLLLPGMEADALRATLLACQQALALADCSFGNHPYRPAEALSASFLAVHRERLDVTSAASLIEQLDERLAAQRMSTIPPSAQTALGPSKAKRNFVTVGAWPKQD